MKLIKKLLLSLFFISASADAQFPGFNLEVGKTDETCPGNGSLTFSVSGVVQGASILYKVYLLPNTVTPIAVQQGNYLGSLQSGTYSVVAIQSLGSQNATQQRNITIARNVTDLNFTITAINQNCTPGGTIIINNVSGTATSYEIMAGPVTRPLQTGNVFHNLPYGNYTVRVFDECGIGKTKNYTIAFVNSVLNVSGPVYPDVTPETCDLLTVNHIITAQEGVITYPLTVNIDYNAMDIYGNEISFQEVFENGPEDELVISSVLPRPQQTIGYTLKVINNCSVAYEVSDEVTDPGINLTLSAIAGECADRYLSVNVSKVVAPYTIEFLTAPEGFNPIQYINNFSSSQVFYGSESQPIPFGEYKVLITDACGRIKQESILIEYEQYTPIVEGSNFICSSMVGTIKVNIPYHSIVSGTIVAAPDNYTENLPHNVNGFILEEPLGQLGIYNVPIGMYTIEFTDDCGFTYTRDVEVPPYTEREVFATTLRGCGSGKGSVKINCRNNDFISVHIISAPAAFGQQLPYNASDNIYDEEGDFYMNDLPQGQYVFKTVNTCGVEKIVNADVEGYTTPENPVIFNPHCGSFSVNLQDRSRGLNNKSYWLQRYNTTTGQWEHPTTGVAYTEGTLPTRTTGISLQYNMWKHNFEKYGKYRVLKTFRSFGNGTNEFTECYDVLDEFIFSESFDITSVYSLACLGQPNDVFVEVMGHPTAISIIEKNGQPFFIHNGLENIFTNLEPAEYSISVEDVCGNIIVKKFNLLELPSIAQATTPDDMIVCVEENILNPLYQFRLRDQDTFILGSLHSSMYTLTYHITQQDADNGSNPLPEYYSSAGNGEIIYARLVHNDISLCHGTTSFKLFVMHKPAPAITTTGTLCSGDGGTYLVAPDGFTNYLWSTGEITRSIFITEPGYYSVKVKLGDNDRLCEGFAEIVITESAAPAITDVEIRDWTDDENMITVFAEGMGNLLYSIDGENWQEDNVFTGLVNGFYTVFVKDAGGCGMVSKEVTLLNYPKFFTPNGDGINDTWRIKYSVKEPNLKINILDRFGKVVSSFGSNHEGWNGTFNGEKLPSTDYWFVVTREDGRELKGHFAMIR